MGRPLQKGFGVYFDPSKTTSGQRFFRDLCRALSAEALPREELPAVMLFNVSAPLKAILKAKWNQQKIALRIDGLYFDRLGPTFLAEFKWPLRQLLAVGLRFAWAHDFLAFWANLLNQNYGAFARIVFADWVIYQSAFSRQIHRRYFPLKSYSVIVNGSILRASSEAVVARRYTKEIRLITIYDEWRPSKRMQDIVEFVQWANESKEVTIHLTILGYTGKIPDCAQAEMKGLIETSPFIRTLPRFKAFGSEIRRALFESDIYMSFSYRDSCPNTVVEAMAHGLPVVGVGSGGVPDIVGDAGILLPMDDFADGLFTSHRWEYAFPSIDFAKILVAVRSVMENYEEYQERVRERFKTQLDMDVVAERYAAVLRHLAEDSS